jgi:hypothetical protein
MYDFGCLLIIEHADNEQENQHAGDKQQKQPITYGMQATCQPGRAPLYMPATILTQRTKKGDGELSFHRSRNHAFRNFVSQQEVNENNRQRSQHEESPNSSIIDRILADKAVHAKWQRLEPF